MRLDLAKIIESKNPKLYRRLPRFVINWAQRLIHQEQMNYCLENYAHLPSVEFARASLEYIGIGYSSEGLDKIDKNGRYIFASNHPFGGVDGLMLAAEVAKPFGDVRLVVNDLLMNLEPLRSIFIPVNKHGRQSTEAAKLFAEAFDSNVPIVTFPAGLCSREIDGQIKDPLWQTNFVKRAVASKRDVVPVYFEGQLSRRFYRISRWRKVFGIKANMEMFTLVDEMFAQKGKHFTMRFGTPVSWQELEKAHSLRQATEMLRKNTYNLSNK